MDFLRRYIDHHDKKNTTPLKKVIVKLQLRNLRPIQLDQHEALINQRNFNEPISKSILSGDKEEEQKYDVAAYFKYTSGTRVRLVEL